MGLPRVGIVGYGHLGQYLADEITKRDDMKLAFVWNRTPSALTGFIDEQYILQDLDNFVDRAVDLIVEVAHPSITRDFGAQFLKHADYLVGSPTALADADIEQTLRAAANQHGVYIPSGALWGGEDIKKMADRGMLQAMKITMTKHPSCFKLEEPLKSKNCEVKSEAVTIFDGPVRELCRLAPNNVNTMAAAALAAHSLGFDKVQGSIVADPNITDWHVVQIDVWGHGDIENGTAFHCQTIRRNPSKLGVVTGSATYTSFLSSVLGAKGKGAGIHLC